MKTRNLVILIFMLISLGLYPAKRYRSNKKRVSRGQVIVIRRRKIKYNSNKFLRDLEIIEKGLAKDIYNGLDHIINEKNIRRLESLNKELK